MLAKTTLLGLGLCATLGLVALANVAAPAADASTASAPDPRAAYPVDGGLTPACVVVIQDSHVEGPICSSHFSYERTTVEWIGGRCCPDGAPENGPAPCGCPERPASDGPAYEGGDRTYTEDNDVVDAKEVVTIGEVTVYDVVDVNDNDVDVFEDIIENSNLTIVQQNVGGLPVAVV